MTEDSKMDSPNGASLLEWETPRVIVERISRAQTHKALSQNYDYTPNSGPAS